MGEAKASKTAILTKDQMLRVLPKRLKGNYTDAILDSVNKCAQDQSFREFFRDNVLSYTSVMQSGRYKLTSYVSAVKYVSHKLLGDKDIEAYAKTFPDRYQRMKDEGNSQNVIASFASAFKKNKLVQGVFEQSIMPTHILNADLFQKAINTQAELMMNARSEKVRSDAASSLMTHLKPPETKKIELDIGLKQDQSLADLREATGELVRMQRKQMEDGNINALEIANSTIIKTVDSVES